FSETVFPTLTPLAFDPGRPFPHISNLSLNLAVLIRDHQGVEHFARVKVPDSLPQLVPLNNPVKESKTKSKSPKPQYFVWLEQLIVNNLQALFPGTKILDILLKNLELDPGDVYKMKGPLALNRLKHLLSIDRTDLKDKAFVPAL